MEAESREFAIGSAQVSHFFFFLFDFLAFAHQTRSCGKIVLGSFLPRHIRSACYILFGRGGSSVCRVFSVLFHRFAVVETIWRHYCGVAIIAHPVTKSQARANVNNNVNNRGKMANGFFFFFFHATCMIQSSCLQCSADVNFFEDEGVLAVKWVFSQHAPCSTRGFLRSNESFRWAVKRSNGIFDEMGEEGWGRVAVIDDRLFLEQKNRKKMRARWWLVGDGNRKMDKMTWGWMTH